MHILVVDDDPTYRRTLVRMLERQNYIVEGVGSATECLARLGREPEPALILLDVMLPDVTGVDLLPTIRERSEAAVIMVSGTGTVQIAVQSLKLGAADFVEKTAMPERLQLSVRNVLRLRRLEKAHAQLISNESSTALIGDAPVMKALRTRIERVAPTDSRVLILGENGTGKELIAREIHEQSRRVAGPFIAMNCAAVPGELIETELFGHEAGAYTGAQKSRRGRFERAHGGTLFLDEIGDMPTAMQPKLLRVLQEGEFERVGGSETKRVDVRVLAATNQDLQAKVASGAFREDLYYRLAVIELRSPPLRDRPGDIGLLVEYFRTRAAKRAGLDPVHFSNKAIALLERYSYPGNVRELQNIVERLTVLADRNIVDAMEVCQEVPAVGHLDVDGETIEVAPRSEGERIREALTIAEGRKAEAAKILGISRSTLWRKMRQFGLDA